ncbi:hypothetical protein BDV96DRAFT_639052 [Lophiotrema nucula]|uniref:Uncharacterized protein n=1 Tax=Lophiotrema nucula TaxID=690887 RepID=A0A6A5ZTQ7_9PLEO|nr:hypothetical protein BDV96DRAFT_639052 [Lophiotrema nucula]
MSKLTDAYEPTADGDAEFTDLDYEYFAQVAEDARSYHSDRDFTPGFDYVERSEGYDTSSQDEDEDDVSADSAQSGKHLQLQKNLAKIEAGYRGSGVMAKEIWKLMPHRTLLSVQRRLTHKRKAQRNISAPSNMKKTARGVTSAASNMKNKARRFTSVPPNVKKELEAPPSQSGLRRLTRRFFAATTISLT